MTREEAIKYLGWLKNETRIIEYRLAISMAVAAILEQVKRRWIPVTERLPKLIPCSAGTGYSETVNVLTNGRKVLTAIYDGNGFIADAEFWDAEGEEITHWAPVLLPLPEQPKEGAEGLTTANIVKRTAL